MKNQICVHCGQDLPRFKETSVRVILDTRTELEWYVGPDEDIDYYQAEEWVNNLTVSGGGWRMPTIDELRGIYEKDERVDRLFRLSDSFVVWSSSVDDDVEDENKIKTFLFRGKKGCPCVAYTDRKHRAFAVRERFLGEEGEAE